MLNPSVAAAEAMTAAIRRLYIKAVIDLVDPDFTYTAPASSEHTPQSRLVDIYNKKTEADRRYVTLEPGRWPLDGTWVTYPDDPSDIDGESGFISASMCDENGVFESPPWVQLNVENCRVLQATAVAFTGISEDGYGVDFTVDILAGSDVVYTEEVTGNTESIRYFEGFTVFYPTAIRVTITSWSIPQRRARVVEIVPGIYETWQNDTVYSVDIMQETDFSCMTLPYGVVDLEIWNRNKRFDPRNKSGLFLSIEERQAIPLFIAPRLDDGETEHLPCGVYYQRNGGWETGHNGLTMKFKLCDIIGLLSERKYDPPQVLPTTLGGWAASLVAQLGENFKPRYIVDEDVAQYPLTCTAADVENITCGQLLRFICMASGTFPRADSATGYLRISLPPTSGGANLTFDNLSAYPVAKANEDIAAIIFRLGSSTDEYIVSGTNTASSMTLSISNFFIKTTAQADIVARNIIQYYGGQQYETRGRGDVRTELGDLDTLELGLGAATGGRRFKQQFRLSAKGIMRDVQSHILQATGEGKYSDTVVITRAGMWTAPAGVTELRIVLIGGGTGGDGGTGGGIWSSGKGGAGGKGGRVFTTTIPINSGQTFNITLGSGGAGGASGWDSGAPGQPGGDTAFGIYSSREGVVFSSWVDIATGDAFAIAGKAGQDGIKKPAAGAGGAPSTGNGGGGGSGGAMAVLADTGGLGMTIIEDPTPGGPGGRGGSGLVIVSYDKEDA